MVAVHFVTFSLVLVYELVQPPLKTIETFSAYFKLCQINYFVKSCLFLFSLNLEHTSHVSSFTVLILEEKMKNQSLLTSGYLRFYRPLLYFPSSASFSD